MVQGVIDLFPVKEECGNATISQFEFSSREDPLFNMRAVRDGGMLFYVDDGKYVRLHVDGELVMSDTGLERRSNREFISKAHGRILVAGLGIGLILKNMLDKPDVTEVIVIEKYQSVIDLVAPKFNNTKLKIICADIWEWKPNKGELFNVIYFDIWPSINEDNLGDIRKLHAQFKYFLDRSDPNCWMDSWMKKFLQDEKRRAARSRW